MASNFLKNFSSPYPLNRTEPPPFQNPHSSPNTNFRDSKFFPQKFSEPHYLSEPNQLNPKSMNHRSFVGEFPPNNSFVSQQRIDQRSTISEPFRENSRFNNPPISNSSTFKLQRTLELESKSPLPFQERIINFPNQDIPIYDSFPTKNHYSSSFSLKNDHPGSFIPKNDDPIAFPLHNQGREAFPFSKYSQNMNPPPFRSMPPSLESPMRRPPEPILNKPLIHSTIKPAEFQPQPPLNFHNENNIPLRVFPMAEPRPLESIIQWPPPPIFYSHKLNEQPKENNVFPDFITAFGTYRHYDLANRQSKFRKNAGKKEHGKTVENNFTEDMSYLNVNFLQQTHYDKVFDALKNFVYFDRNIEKIKEELTHKSDFDLRILFQYFDDNNTGQIVAAEWKEGFAKLGISAEENDIFLMINRYSMDGNKKIS